MSALRIDHIVYAVADLDAAGAWFADELGLGSAAGGVHPGWGTANSIVPLGRDYVELVAVVDAAQATRSAFGRAVIAALEADRRLAGWAVATDDLDGVARRLGLQIVEGARRRPDGSVLRWRLAGVEHALSSGALPGSPSSGALPLFIQWDCPPSMHPGASAAKHRVTPSGVSWVEVGAEPASLGAWLGDAQIPVRAIAGAPAGLLAVGLASSEGELVLR